MIIATISILQKSKLISMDLLFLMNEVIRYRPLLRETIRSDINVKELSENQYSSPVRNYRAMGMSELVGLFIARVSCCSSPTVSDATKQVEESLFLLKSVLISDVLSLVPHVTDTYTCRS